MEKDIIYTALENLRLIVGIEALWQDRGPLDGMLDFTNNGQKFTFVVALKGELRTHELQQIEEYCHINQYFLLVAKRIFPKIQEELRQREIPYLEANGSIYLKQDNIFLFVNTQKPLDIKKSKVNRAFTKTGLKVLFYL